MFTKEEMEASEINPAAKLGVKRLDIFLAWSHDKIISYSNTWQHVHLTGSIFICFRLLRALSTFYVWKSGNRFSVNTK